MNVIVSNKYRDLLNSLDFDISKNINGVFTVDEIIQTFSNFFFNRMFLDITAIKDYQNLENIQKLSIALDMSKVILLLDDDVASGSPAYLSQLISMGIYNFTRNKEGLIYLYNHPNTYRDVAQFHQINNFANNIASSVQARNVNQQNELNYAKVIGFKNLTTHAGATTLIYMLKKILSSYYSVIAIEVDKRDFIFFNDKEMISTTSNQLFNEIRKHNNVDIILVDLNNASEDGCNDVVYLIEPSTIKLNKMIMIDRNIFNKLVNKKIVLNKSLLDSRDVSEFEHESSSKVFYTIPPLNDKNDNSEVLLPFLSHLGLVDKTLDYDDNEKRFSLFKF